MHPLRRGIVIAVTVAGVIGLWQLSVPATAHPSHFNTKPALVFCGLTGGCPVIPPPVTTPTPVPCTPQIPHTLRRGAHGLLVNTLQALLALKGFNPGPNDGRFGRLTKAAVIAFQTSRGLKPDGIVGPATWFALLC